MKTFDAATIRDMAEDYNSKVMLAAMAALCIRFIQRYMAAYLWFYTINIRPLFNQAYVRKRITHTSVHDRKEALFTKNPNSRAGLFGIR
ncbi:hypothetical protein SAMN05216464_111164 [Mucilaginibacter pineti]|uniref:Uncharacterized protein n=1 Tax=Mucilaginibacter pineti TaxID=1391627 RepID=A0A1G7HC70_9SPHI|nr:hypothetical protein [Mucilaginibacter pineti]SDE98052.1 hypothetical protein SAMN05216464_111164 [Mucilaginibacter pineti]